MTNDGLTPGLSDQQVRQIAREEIARVMAPLVVMLLRDTPVSQAVADLARDGNGGRHDN